MRESGRSDRGPVLSAAPTWPAGAGQWWRSGIGLMQRDPNGAGTLNSITAT